MTAPAEILVVEDDARLAGLIRDYLQQQGYRVTVEGRGDRAVERILAANPDIVVLDWMLPGQDGLEICRRVRSAYTGQILMLTAREDDTDQVVGLELGADDYVKKPVEPRVLLARIRALLRRNGGSGTPKEAPDDRNGQLAFGPLRICRRSRTATLAEQALELTTREFDLLWILAGNAGRIMSREEILHELRGIDYDGLDRSVDIAVSRLRKKLDDDTAEPRRIKTIWHKGYLFVKEGW
jgi:two-component system response regulator RstA